MTPQSPLGDLDGEIQRFGRAIRRRYRLGRLRIAQAALIAVLAYFATDSLLAVAWFGGILLSGAIEAVVGRRARDADDPVAWRRPAAAAQLLSALAFCMIA